MKELTIVIDDWENKELKEYLMSLNGVLDVKIDDNDKLEIYIKYDSSLITEKVLKMEINLFLDLKDFPAIISFNKHPKNKLEDYTIIREDFCCEYCYKIAIEELFDAKGVEIVESNFYEKYWLNKDEEQNEVYIKISYDPKIISFDKMKELEVKLDI